MSRGGNHYARLHFVGVNGKTACGRSIDKSRVTDDAARWERQASYASGDLCAACRANVRKLEAKS